MASAAIVLIYSRPAIAQNLHESLQFQPIGSPATGQQQQQPHQQQSIGQTRPQQTAPPLFTQPSPQYGEIQRFQDIIDGAERFALELFAVTEIYIEREFAVIVDNRHLNLFLSVLVPFPEDKRWRRGFRLRLYHFAVLHLVPAGADGRGGARQNVQGAAASPRHSR